jgi:hypothetical protein
MTPVLRGPHRAGCTDLGVVCRRILNNVNALVVVPAHWLDLGAIGQRVG